jgi:hypothetical protein
MADTHEPDGGHVPSDAAGEASELQATSAASAPLVEDLDPARAEVQEPRDDVVV